jgi:hypothetical protein
MKKFIIFFFIFIFSSCSFSNQNNDFNDRIINPEEQTQKESTLEGVIQKKELNIKDKSTHILEGEDLRVLAKLRSIKIPLSSFENLKVKLKGVFDKEEVFLVNSLEIIKEDKEKKEDEKELIWKDYTTEDQIFSFSYPENWDLIDARQVLYLQNEENEKIIKITKLSNLRNLSLKEFVKNGEEKILNNLETITKIEEDQFNLYFKTNEKIIKITYKKDLSDSEKIEKFLNSFNLITEKKEIIPCGGEENNLCPEGYRCELKENGQGVCRLKNEIINDDVIEYGKEEKEDQKNIEEEEEEEEELKTEKTKENYQDDIFKNIVDLEGDLYENKHMNFKSLYPKYWYYRSFGAKNNNLWQTEFSSQEINELNEGEIFIKIKNGARGINLLEEDNFIKVLLPRDTNSHFEVSGNKNLKEKVLGVAKSIQNL